MTKGEEKKKRRIPVSAPKRPVPLSGRIFLHILGKLRKGSLTVEAALVLPLFLFGMITMLSLMDVYRLQTEHLLLALSAAESAAAKITDPGGQTEVRKTETYVFSPPGGFFMSGGIPLSTSVTVHAWNGADPGEIAGYGTGLPQEKMVYMARYGNVIHTDLSCSYLSLSIHQVPGAQAVKLHNKYGQSYHPCESCSRGKAPAGVVYVTEEGTRYHNQATCSRLKRTVRLVPESEAGACRPCSRCGGEHH